MCNEITFNAFERSLQVEKNNDIVYFLVTGASNDASMTHAILSQTPELASIGGKQYRLKTSIWRDFMPRIVQDSCAEMSTIPGSCLIAALTISTEDSSDFPDSVTANLAWFILDETHIWKTKIVEESSRTPGAKYLRVMARHGPKWGPKVSVDVIIQLENVNGDTALLQAKRQNIYQTC